MYDRIGGSSVFKLVEDGSALQKGKQIGVVMLASNFRIIPVGVRPTSSCLSCHRERYYYSDYLTLLGKLYFLRILTSQP